MKRETIPNKPGAFLRQVLRPYRWQFAIFFVLSGAGNVCFVGATFVVRTLINELSVHPRLTAGVWWLVILFGLLRFVDEWLWRYGENRVRWFLPNLREGVRRTLFETTLGKGHGFFVNANSGQLGYWINGATDMVQLLVETTIWSVWSQVVALVASAVFLLWANWMLAVIFALWLVGLMATVLYRGRKQTELVDHTSEMQSRASGRIVDVMANNLPVRVFGAHRHEITMLAGEQREIKTRWRRSWWYEIVTNAIKGNSAAAVSTISMVLVVVLYARGQIGVGDIALLVTYITTASQTIWELSFQLSSYFRSFGALKNAVTNLLTEGEERTDGLVLKTDQLKVEFAGLGFHYPDQPEQGVLTDVNLVVEPGVRVGIVGHSGAGKSTIVAMLLGLYEPTEGKLLFNGEDVRGLNLESLRRHIAYVPQDTSLFNRSIAENIAYGSPNHVTEAEIELAAERAQALEFIRRLPKGFETLVGERGVKLSGGQRQRIAIARAMLSAAPLVVLDEATSALDSANEQLIQMALGEVMKARSAIVIAHRLSTLQHLDLIMVLDKGRVAQVGTHAELREADGIYADLWRRQKDGFIGD